MAVLAQFGGIQFGISGETALLFGKLKLSAECETDDKTDNSQAYVAAKKGKAAELTMTVTLSASFGIRVKDETMRLLNAAQRGTQDYLYVKGEKVFPFKLMVTKAETEEIALSPTGVWVQTSVNVTMKQCSKEWILEPEKEETPKGGGGGGDSTPSYTPQKATVKTTTPSKTAQDALWERGSAYQGVGAHPVPKYNSSNPPLQNQSIAAQQTAQNAVSKATKTTQTAKTNTSTVTRTSYNRAALASQ